MVVVFIISFFLPVKTFFSSVLFFYYIKGFLRSFYVIILLFLFFVDIHLYSCYPAGNRKDKYMIVAIILLRIILFIWILGIVGLLLYKISSGSLQSTRISILLLFPILLLTHKGRIKIKGELK